VVRCAAPPSDTCPLLATRAQAQQLASVATYFIWQGSIFKIPTTTLQRPKREGGWGLPHAEIKCRALLYNKIQLTGTKQATVLTNLLRTWDLGGPIKNPPPAQSLPGAFAYLQQYAINMAYVPLHQAHESRRAFKRRIYETLLHMTHANTGPSALKITRKYPDVNWTKVWRSL
jgi:hypothetical protein